jgi:hypothetical protein
MVAKAKWRASVEADFGNNDFWISKFAIFNASGGIGLDSKLFAIAIRRSKLVGCLWMILLKLWER